MYVYITYLPAPLGATMLRGMLHVLQDLCCLPSCSVSDSLLFTISLLISNHMPFRFEYFFGTVFEGIRDPRPHSLRAWLPAKQNPCVHENPKQLSLSIAG